TDGSEHAITIGTRAEHARRSRGANTLRRASARTEDNEPPPELVDRWEDAAWPSAAERSYVLSGLGPMRRPFSPFPGVDLVDVYRFLELQPSSVRSAPRRPTAR